MTDAEILQKAVEQAVGNKEEVFDYIAYYQRVTEKELSLSEKVELTIRYYCKEIDSDHGEHKEGSRIKTRGFIFSHDFAKAFFGDGVSEWNEDNPFDPQIGLIRPLPWMAAAQRDWRHHLQQMVLEEDPIRYLEQFLDGEEHAN